jgi:hypothetical protein
MFITLIGVLASWAISGKATDDADVRSGNAVEAKSARPFPGAELSLLPSESAFLCEICGPFPPVAQGRRFTRWPICVRLGVTCPFRRPVSGCRRPT